MESSHSKFNTPGPGAYDVGNGFNRFGGTQSMISTMSRDNLAMPSLELAIDEETLQTDHDEGIKARKSEMAPSLQE
jgi:hypothetical protein